MRQDMRDDIGDRDTIEAGYDDIGREGRNVDSESGSLKQTAGRTNVVFLS